MIFLYLKKNFKYNFIIYLPAYGIWRFLIEYVRDDERGQIFKGVEWLSPSQFFALVMVVGTIPVFFLIRYLYKNSQDIISPVVAEENETIEESTREEKEVIEESTKKEG